MYPILLKIGSFTIYSYGVMMAIAVLVCSALLSRDAKKFNIPSEVIVDFVFWVVLAGILGARIFYVLLNLDYFTADPVEIIRIQNGGLAWQGGLVVGLTTAIFMIRQRKLPFWPTADLMAPYVALGHSIGRIGCFLNGCCYGKEVPWGIYFPVHGARLHPTQLYESVSLFLIFLILKKAQTKNFHTGKVFVLYFLLASLERFVVEFFRADHTILFLGLSLFQWISLIIIAIAFYVNTRLSAFPKVRGAHH